MLLIILCLIRHLDRVQLLVSYHLGIKTLLTTALLIIPILDLIPKKLEVINFLNFNHFIGRKSMTKGNNYSNMIVASSSHSNRSELPELKQ